MSAWQKVKDFPICRSKMIYESYNEAIWYIFITLARLFIRFQTIIEKKETS